MFYGLIMFYILSKTDVWQSYTVQHNNDAYNWLRVSINQLCISLCRWMICCTSWESRYCWQHVGWRWALRWRLKCDLMSTSTSDFHQSVIASTRSSGTNASIASSNDLSKVCLHSLHINDSFISLFVGDPNTLTTNPIWRTAAILNKRLCDCRRTARRATSFEILWPFFDWAIDKKLC